MRFVAVDVPPPGPGLTTLTRWTPPELRLPDGTVAVNCVEDEKVVEIDVVSRLTTDCETKFVPTRLITVFEVPAANTEGEMEVKAGWGVFDREIEGVGWSSAGRGIGDHNCIGSRGCLVICAQRDGQLSGIDKGNRVRLAAVSGRSAGEKI